MTRNVKLVTQQEAYDQAQRFIVPKLADGEFVKLPNFETLHAYMELHGLKVKGWRGDILVLISDQKMPNGLQKE